MTRPRATRFTPLACTDDAGRFLGILRIERLMAHLAGQRLTRPGSSRDARDRDRRLRTWQVDGALGASRRGVVETKRIELSTPALQRRCSAN